ncbi:MAG TPA: MCE family protein [Nocardioides sp.]|nr:MCE family protein [Nocardioides sp.]
MTPMTRKLRALVAILLGTVVLTGCDFDVYKLPLPGGTDVGDDPLTITVQFTDVLDLVPKTSVKVNDVNVGRVTDIELTDQTATVTLELRNTTELPENAIAEIRQTSLLGEKFVSLKPPEDEAPEGELGDGDEIPLERTGRNPEVEEVLGALSLVLNGGGVAQLKTIASEINLALEGREDAAKSVLTQVESLMGQLAANKKDIVRAIKSLNELAVTAREQQGSIDAALEELPSALDSVNRQRDDLVKMLQSLNELGDVGVRVIKESKDVTIQTFRQLQPVLTQLVNSGDSFVDAFNVFLTFPFVDEVVGRDPQVARNLHMGDYTNLSIDIELNLNKIPGVCFPLDAIPPLGELPPLGSLCQEVQDGVQECVDEVSTNLGVKECLAGLLGKLTKITDKLLCQMIPTACRKGRLLGGIDDAVDDLLGGLTGGLLNNGGGGNGNGNGNGGGDLGGLLDDLTGGLTGNLGLGRAPFGDLAADDRGRALSQMMTDHDRALVSLLMTPMVVGR